jgi:hypothetical protein
MIFFGSHGIGPETYIFEHVFVDDENEHQHFVRSVERLRTILTNVNDAVAFHQNSNEFKKIFDNIDPKSYTYIVTKKNCVNQQRRMSVGFNLA